MPTLSQDSTEQRAAVAGEGVAVGVEVVFEGVADGVAQRGEGVGCGGFGDVGRGDFEPELPVA
ncbi:hypothetical protein GCM10009864_65210 [Streptomyces lunalinharesii]|uniref:Uncharacterized protein n=1 Tax=Streptomyces lunalinharesii TaxID=333384 RepID=A0ABN3SRB0_9ACTN